jgi:molecular chaperone GrpE (heat shock protein)
MLAAEFIFVFHETASSYTSRTQAMNQSLREAGIDLPLHPMLRLKYSTWDALEGVAATLRLPSHLASAFGVEEISASEFAATWHEASDRQDASREALKACQSPRDLMQHLADAPGQFGRAPIQWPQKLDEYDGARAIITKVREASAILATQSEALHLEVKQATHESTEIEKRKGEDWRQNVQPLRLRLSDIREAASARITTTGKLTKEERAARTELEAAEEREIEALRAQIEVHMQERASFDAQIEDYRNRAREARSRAKELTKERVATERSEAAHAARETILRIEYEAELERLLRIRDALMATGSLKYTNYRPTAWWFPLVSPDGVWFNGLVRTAQARMEEL